MHLGASYTVYEALCTSIHSSVKHASFYAVKHCNCTVKHSCACKLMPHFVGLYKELDNPQALASIISHTGSYKAWCNYFIPPSSLKTVLSMKYFVLKLAFSGKVGINTPYICFICCISTLKIKRINEGKWSSEFNSLSTRDETS